MSARQKYPKSLTPLPSHPWIHNFHWADYVELLCLVNPDVMVTEADVLDRIPEREADLGEGGTDLEPTEDVAEKRDKWEERVDTWFQHLSYRQSSFGGAYPFTLSSSTRGHILRLQEDLSSEQELYLSLLFSANLWSVPSFKNIFADSFEVISLFALKQYLPGTAKVFLFGSTSLTDDELTDAGVNIDRYSESTLWDRMNSLAETLREKVMADPAEFPPSNKGDGGLDIVAMLHPKDKAPGMFIVFGQCACTVEWETKQFSSHWVNWRDNIRFLVFPVNAVFVPHCFRNTDGQWHTRRSISDSVLFDRLRILQLLNGYANAVKDLPALVITRGLAKLRESIV